MGKDFIRLLEYLNLYADNITNISMSETYASVDYVINGTKRMLTIMTTKEEENAD